MQRRALITGVTGQDGSYLADFLLAKGYEVYGLVRYSTRPLPSYLDERITLLDGDLLDQSSLERVVDRARPHEVYNLAALSHVGTSFNEAIAVGEINALGTARLLNVLRGSYARFYQASTSELYGGLSAEPLNEQSPFHPRSPYGCSKLYAHWTTINYRESYDMFTCCGILFNHESPRRGEHFVTRKITKGVAEIAAGKAATIHLGNIDAYRDWGFAGDYVEAMWLMLQQDTPDDYVIATGVARRISDFLAEACHAAGLPEAWQHYVTIDSSLYRPADVHTLIGDATKAQTVLGWQPRVPFEQLVALMVEHDREDFYETQRHARSGAGRYHCAGSILV